MLDNVYRKEESVTYQKKIDAELTLLPPFMKEYADEVSADLKPSTLYQYVRDIHIFLLYMMDKSKAIEHTDVTDITLSSLGKITHDEMSSFRSFYMRTHSRATVRRMLSSVSALYSFYIKRGKLTVNVAASVMLKTKKSDRKKEINRLRGSETEEMLSGVYSGRGLTKRQLDFHDKLGLRDYCILRVFLFTGIRVSELVGLDISDVHLSDSSLSVVRKGGVRERVYYDDETGMVLAEYLDMRKQNKFDNGDPALFLSNRNKRSTVRNIELMIKKYASAILPEHEGVSPHKLRATFATDFYVKSGGDLLLTAKRMGHESVATTTIYAEATKQREKDSRNILLDKSDGSEDY